ncbi:MAG: hypothetical protein IPL46_01125 [Saprospiraceae bacterium]|nr:hypothetical protein [Saprospiraceae bacterium]
MDRRGLSSMKGSQRAKPPTGLFTKIEDQITVSKAKVVPMFQWRYAAAAAALVLMVNTSALLYYNQLDQLSYDETTAVDAYGQALISTYQIYK